MKIHDFDMIWIAFHNILLFSDLFLCRSFCTIYVCFLLIELANPGVIHGLLLYWGFEYWIVLCEVCLSRSLFTILRKWSRKGIIWIRIKAKTIPINFTSLILANKVSFKLEFKLLNYQLDKKRTRINVWNFALKLVITSLDGSSSAVSPAILTTFRPFSSFWRLW